MAKLTEQQWRKARETWEADSRDGYAWLIRELGLDVSGPAVRKRALKEEWSKGGGKAKPGGKPKTQKPKAKTRNRKPRQKPETPVEELEELPPELADKAGDACQVTQQGGSETTARGRPSEYRPEYAEQAYRLMLLGMTRGQVAQFFEVSEATIYNWCREQPEFLESIKRGAALADAEVAEALYRRAVGVVLPETHVSNYQGDVTLTHLERHYPPDTAAARMWLKNRQPEMWKDKVEVEEKPSIALVDREARRERIEAALEKAAQVEREMRDRANRLGLIIDGSTGEVDDGGIGGVGDG